MGKELPKEREKAFEAPDTNEAGLSSAQEIKIRIDNLGSVVVLCNLKFTIMGGFICL